eukprot:COSAG05_NODE_2667_length_2783_cov_7.122951_4_plen_49_part_00
MVPIGRTTTVLLAASMYPGGGPDGEGGLLISSFNHPLHRGYSVRLYRY